ncbi:hypothetical protein ACVW1B_001963 [Bradyrhizobium sp. USDA 4502]
MSRECECMTHRQRNTCGVVPAKAGTHSRRRQLACSAGATTCFNNAALWLWVPAFAGTTCGKSSDLSLCHRPRMRTIQYAAASRFKMSYASAVHRIAREPSSSSSWRRPGPITPNLNCCAALERRVPTTTKAAAYGSLLSKAGTTPESAVLTPPPQSTPRRRATAHRGGRCGRSRDGRSLLRRRRRDGSR